MQVYAVHDYYKRCCATTKKNVSLCFFDRAFTFMFKNAIEMVFYVLICLRVNHCFYASLENSSVLV